MTVLKYRTSDGTWHELPAGPQGETGPQGPPGPGLWIGTDEPTDPTIRLWYDPDAVALDAAGPQVVDALVSTLDTPADGGSPNEAVSYRSTPTETVTAVTTP